MPTGELPQTDGLLADVDVPPDRDRESLDVRELPPPEPLTETLERPAALDDHAVLVQVNDRIQQHLFPKLDERGFAYDAIEADDGTDYTDIWSAR
ncbi:DUF2249 domain-containing protein [Halorubellus salinus]|uniref:DUF2249 domain-containing protein n=1 Tax=Halorubellus salinus TaxID=755309 RepID=UPI001D07C766|nr:DUF2249 domain-containing protein [Halorubellus salinus]